MGASVTENSLPGWTESLQGVRQLSPNEVFASAPGGSDSMASVSGCGVDFRKSRLGIVAEHAASMKPHAMRAMTRLMIGSPPPGRRSAASPPRQDHRGATAPVQPRVRYPVAMVIQLKAP